MTNTRPATFEEALREVETGNTPMDTAVMSAILGELEMKYARATSDYKTMRGYAIQLNDQCDAQAKRIEELESELANMKDDDNDSSAAV